MEDFTLSDLKNRVKKRYDKLREQQKQRYQLARELGFNSQEAVILQNRTPALIRKLARERQTGGK